MNEKRENPIGLDGLEFIEFTSPNPDTMRQIFIGFGFTKVANHRSKDVELWKQNDINLILNNEKDSFGKSFADNHGPSVCALGFRVKNSSLAIEKAVERGARKFEENESRPGELNIPAIYGIGDSLIYFIDRYGDNSIYDVDFEFIPDVEIKDNGLISIDHLTHNVGPNKMNEWLDFYSKIFNFRSVRYFDIKGEQTGLVSKVVLSPDNSICIPINEPTEDKSQIQEFLDEYNGEGVQHIAFKTKNIIKSLDAMRSANIDFLDVPETYYEDLPKRPFEFTEPINDLKRLSVLVDGDEEGYLLQIFTKNQFGPIFIEIIQRENHYGFGEGNFQALFEAIERDQRERGYL